MLSHKILALGLLLISQQALAYNFKAVTGTTWTFDIPKGWHVIDHPKGLAEGISIRIASSPQATWDNPAPPVGHAMINIGFYNAKNDPVAAANASKPQKQVHNGPLTLDYKGIVVDGYQIPIWVITNNNDIDTSAALATITSTLKVKP